MERMALRNPGGIIMVGGKRNIVAPHWAQISWLSDSPEGRGLRRRTKSGWPHEESGSEFIVIRQQYTGLSLDIQSLEEVGVGG